MTISPIGAAPSIQAESQTSVGKTTVSQAAATALPSDTVSLSSAAQKASGGDVDHDGDSH
jgi:hypothetical protein